MKFTAILMLTAILIGPALAECQPSDSNWTWIQTVLENYSERTGSKFVLDPRVNIKAQLVGFDVDDIDYPTLSRIFLMHGYKAVEIDNVIYVVLEAAPAEFLDRLTEKVEE